MTVFIKNNLTPRVVTFRVRLTVLGRPSMGKTVSTSFRVKLRVTSRVSTIRLRMASALFCLARAPSIMVAEDRDSISFRKTFRKSESVEFDSSDMEAISRAARLTRNMSFRSVTVPICCSLARENLIFRVNSRKVTFILVSVRTRLILARRLKLKGLTSSLATRQFSRVGRPRWRVIHFFRVEALSVRARLRIKPGLVATKGEIG